MTLDNHPEHERRDLSRFEGIGYDKGRGRLIQVAWILTDSLVFRRWWLPAGARVRILRFFGASIGSKVLIRHDVRIHWPWKLEVAHNSWVGAGVWILNLEPVTIGSNTCISQDVMLCAGSHDRRSPTFEFDNRPIRIGSGVWVGTRATVLRGVTVGDDALIGASALVVSDVPPRAKALAPLPRLEERLN